ncbi:unnamed protein product [Schistosoma margrebowiei]|uniref:Uncharacterized protein n=1 Tax=Schistosoma margrebowiei TaxID=48269 RepID=A0A183L913_9TREM|nr:unnamed protein product [Schistosoma margrebowiei]
MPLLTTRATIYLEVLGISETHWTQGGQQRLTSGEFLLYSGHEEENAPHTQEVALMLSKQAQKALIGWESHGSRIIKASFKTKREGIAMNIIQCYVPTNDFNDDAKDHFYDRLQSIIAKCPTKDLTILMGDFNAKVGTDNTGYEDIMGRHGLGERNENGERTCEPSDHHLLITKMKLKLKKHWTTSQKFNTVFLHDTNKLNKFKIVLSNNFQAFHDLLNVEGTAVERNRKRIKEAITSTCHEVLGHKKHHHKEWITVDTLDKIQERRNKKAAINTSRTRAEKAKSQAEYTEVNKQVKRSIRTEKRKYVEDLAMRAEKAAREGNMRQLYDTTKRLSENRCKPERPVKNKEGEVFTNIEEQQNRWVEHFKELFNRSAPLNPSNIEAAPTDLPNNVGLPTIEEVIMAIRQIKSGKAAGSDNIPAKALKADTKSQLYGSLWYNRLDRIHHSTSTSLTTRRHLIAWIEQHYGTLRHASEDSQYHTEFLLWIKLQSHAWRAAHRFV